MLIQRIDEMLCRVKVMSFFYPLYIYFHSLRKPPRRPSNPGRRSFFSRWEKKVFSFKITISKVKATPAFKDSAGKVKWAHLCNFPFFLLLFPFFNVPISSLLPLFNWVFHSFFPIFPDVNRRHQWEFSLLRPTIKQ